MARLMNWLTQRWDRTRRGSHPDGTPLVVVEPARWVPPPPIFLDIALTPDGTRVGRPEDMEKLMAADHVHDLQGQCLKIRGGSEHCTVQSLPSLDDPEALAKWLDS